MNRPGLTAMAILLLVPAVLLLAGCSSNGLEASARERAKSALEQGLNAWKNGEPAKKWTARTSPVRFTDLEWQKGYKLLEYRIQALRASTTGQPEALVQLTVQSSKGQPEEKTALYGFDLKNPGRISVGRDPMYGL